MINPPPPELFPQPPLRSELPPGQPYRIRRIVTCLVLAVLLFGGGFAVYAWKSTPVEIPTIKAEGPLKQKPEQPGGIDIPNQDVLAYQQIDNSGAKTPPVEHLLPPPEAPQESVPGAPQLTTPNTIAAQSPKVETLLAPPPLAPVVTTVTREKPKEESQAGLAPAPEAAPRSAVVQASTDVMAGTAPPDTAPPQADNPVSSANATAGGAMKSGKPGFRIQVASFPDKETAQHQMAHMEKKYAGALGDAKLHLAKADLGRRGIYYRVQSNPITDTEARDICGAIAKLKGGCIVVKP